MNIIGPLAGFWWKHGTQIGAMFAKGGGSGGSPVVLDLAGALVQFVKKTWPQYNQNGLLDDALKTLEEILAPTVDVSTLS